MSIIVKINSNSSVVETLQVVQGETIVIQAQNGVDYQLVDQATGFAPQKIMAKRVGNDLQLTLEDAGEESNIIIEDYYDNVLADMDSMVVGQHESGAIYSYVPTSSETSEAISVLAENMAAPQALGGNEIFAAGWWFNPSVASVVAPALPVVTAGAVAAIDSRGDDDNSGGGGDKHLGCRHGNR